MRKRKWNVRQVGAWRIVEPYNQSSDGLNISRSSTLNYQFNIKRLQDARLRFARLRGRVPGPLWNLLDQAAAIELRLNGDSRPRVRRPGGIVAVTIAWSRDTVAIICLVCNARNAEALRCRAMRGSFCRLVCWEPDND